MSEKLIFGTSENINFELLAKIYSKSLIFHTSYDYDGYRYRMSALRIYIIVYSFT